MSVPAGSAMKVVAQNRKARHEFHIEESFEAGLVLTGTEVKSLRKGQGSIVEAYVQAAGGELWLVGCNIPPYEHGNIHNVDPVRRRKLLLHKREIEKLAGAVSRKGYAIVPLQVYFKNGRAKVEIGLAKGKKLYDKRQDLKQRDQQREIDRALRSGRR